ncbi:MAG: hypothetical protein WDO19_33395 [Bacteroidota bacterium]
MASSRDQLLICKETAKRKNIPQIKANLDKNNSQRIHDFRVK